MVQSNARIFTSVQDIPRAQWEAVWPTLAEGYECYLGQEQAGLEGFEFNYVGVFAGETLALLAPVFTADFNMTLAMGERGRKHLRTAQRLWPRLMVFKTLFCGSPTSEHGVVAMHPDHRQDTAVIKAFDRALLQLARQQRATMIVFKDFFDADLLPLHALEPLGWFKAESLPTACLAINFNSMDEYLSQLSYGMRKNLRRKLRETEKAGGLHIETTHDISHCIDEAYQLYLSVRDHGELQWEKLTKTYFLNFTRHMPENTVFFLYWLTEPNGNARRLVGFNFCLHFEDRLIDKYIGMDYSISRSLNLYHYSYLNNVQWCIDHKKSRYMLSQGGIEVKQQLGAQPIPLHALTRLVNPVVNWFASRFASPRHQ